MASRIGAVYEAYLRKRPRQSRSRSIVEAVLEAASEAISSGADEESLTVDRIATRAGVSIGSLYDYFSDRKNLLAGLAAKFTDDNRAAFEQTLERTRTLPLRESVELIVDHAFATYTPNIQISRAVLRIAHGVGLMPTMAMNHVAFARMLAAMLRDRSDVRPMDPDQVEATAYVLTNALMGVMAAVIWTESPPCTHARVRDAAIALLVDNLKRDPRVDADREPQDSGNAHDHDDLAE